MQQTHPNIHSTEIRELADWVKGIPLVDGNTGDRSETPAKAAALLQTLALIHEQLSDNEFGADSLDVINDLFSTHGLELFEMDSVCSEEGLQAKYASYPPVNPNQHPGYPRTAWAAEAAAGDTESGYWEWVSNKVQNED